MNWFDFFKLLFKKIKLCLFDIIEKVIKFLRLKKLYKFVDNFVIDYKVQLVLLKFFISFFFENLLKIIEKFLCVIKKKIEKIVLFKIFKRLSKLKKLYKLIKLYLMSCRLYLLFFMYKILYFLNAIRIELTKILVKFLKFVLVYLLDLTVIMQKIKKNFKNFFCLFKKLIHNNNNFLIYIFLVFFFFLLFVQYFFS